MGGATNDDIRPSPDLTRERLNVRAAGQRQRRRPLPTNGGGRFHDRHCRREPPFNAPGKPSYSGSPAKARSPLPHASRKTGYFGQRSPAVDGRRNRGRDIAIMPVHRGNPDYQHMQDSDGDKVTWD